MTIKYHPCGHPYSTKRLAAEHTRCKLCLMIKDGEKTVRRGWLWDTGSQGRVANNAYMRDEWQDLLDQANATPFSGESDAWRRSSEDQERNQRKVVLDGSAAPFGGHELTLVRQFLARRRYESGFFSRERSARLADDAMERRFTSLGTLNPPEATHGVANGIPYILAYANRGYCPNTGRPLPPPHGRRYLNPMIEVSVGLEYVAPEVRDEDEQLSGNYA